MWSKQLFRGGQIRASYLGICPVQFTVSKDGDVRTLRTTCSSVWPPSQLRTMSLYLIRFSHVATFVCCLLSSHHTSPRRGRKVLFCRILFYPVDDQTGLIHWIIQSLVQDFELVFAVHDKAAVRSFLQHVEVQVKSSLKHQYTSHFLLVCYHPQIAEGALHPIIQVVYKNIKQYQALKNTTSRWSPLRLCAVAHHHLSLVSSQFSPTL